MKKLLLSVVALLAVSQMNAQVVIFEDSFEDYENFAITNVGDWTLTDVDGSNSYGFQGLTFTNSGQAFAFIVFNSTATNPAMEGATAAAWGARTGAKNMTSFAAVNAPNNDWLISPQVTLGTSGNVVSFWAKSATVEYGQERFRVGVSTTGTGTADFTIISAGNYVEVGDEWVEFTYDLDAYVGQDVYIAINCVSDDAFGFMVDDFKVEAAALSTNDFFSNNFAVYPNPVNDVINLQSNNSLTIESVTLTDINGRTVAAMNTNGVSNTSMNIANLSAGVYILNVTSNDGIGTAKIVKK